jgi:hypothetical protein
MAQLPHREGAHHETVWILEPPPEKRAILGAASIVIIAYTIGVLVIFLYL